MAISRSALGHRIAQLEGKLAYLLVNNQSPDHFREALHRSVTILLFDADTTDRSWAIEQINAALCSYRLLPLDEEVLKRPITSPDPH
ncbi:hypothetical protein HDE76_001853 [Rhodanobacter sp. ANJX3]|uniref:hypothetical protein n=1 Tax=Rhodanobacter sp. ANJX3 TaxID=2723083 RepID=UPI00161EC671|nr:hypothetical protein [Rhodanobacter sp. ANJX3]MBB5358637.1 hypothetical protein [Rhodanobacter sp. ANJX3]